MGRLSGTIQLKETDYSPPSTQLPIAPHLEVRSSESLSYPCWNIYYFYIMRAAITAEVMNALTLSCPGEPFLLQYCQDFGSTIFLTLLWKWALRLGWAYVPCVAENSTGI